MQGWHTRFSTMLKYPSVLEFIKTIKLDAPHKWMLVAQILADAAPPPQKVNVNARIATLMQGCISLKPQSEKVWQGDTRVFFDHCKEAQQKVGSAIRFFTLDTPILL